MEGGTLVLGEAEDPAGLLGDIAHLSCSQLPLDPQHAPPTGPKTATHSRANPPIPSLMLPLPAPSRWLLRGSDSQTFVSCAWAYFLCPRLPVPHLLWLLRLYFLLQLSNLSLPPSPCPPSLHLSPPSQPPSPRGPRSPLHSAVNFAFSSHQQLSAAQAAHPPTFKFSYLALSPKFLLHVLSDFSFFPHIPAPKAEATG